MVRPDPKVLRALASLENDADWKAVRDWIAASLADTDKNNRRCKDPALIGWNQGQAQALETILDTAAKARASL